MKHLLRLGLICLSMNAMAAEYLCPDPIRTRQDPSKPQRGWTVWKDRVNEPSNPLIAVDLYDGHPKDLAQLVPDNSDSTLESNPRWTFSPERSAWLVCRYRNTDVRLMRELPKGIKSCKVQKKKITCL